VFLVGLEPQMPSVFSRFLRFKPAIVSVLYSPLEFIAHLDFIV
jgi:hypothetical protein